MNKMQLECKRKEFYEEMKSHGFGWINGKFVKPPKEYEIRSEELNCIDMINSILAYKWFGENAESVLKAQEKSYKNYLEKYVRLFGKNKVISLIQGQIDSIKNINRNCGADSEGLVYNSIVWKNEL